MKRKHVIDNRFEKSRIGKFRYKVKYPFEREVQTFSFDTEDECLSDLKKKAKEIIKDYNSCCDYPAYDAWIDDKTLEIWTRDNLRLATFSLIGFPKPKLNESGKLVKEGAGAGYTVGISELKIGEVIDIQKDGEFDYTFTAKIVPGTYEISAEDYYNDFFWEEHEAGIEPEAEIDGGIIHGIICPWEDTDDPEFWIQRQVEGTTVDLTFGYGGGWTHSDLSDKITADHIKISPDPYFEINDIELDAPDLAAAVNSGYASIFDRDEDQDEEPVDESIRTNKDNGKAIKISWRFYLQLENIIGEYCDENPENLDLAAEKALEYLAQLGAKKVKGEDPRNVMISISMPDEDEDDFKVTKSVYQVVEEVAGNNIHMDESTEAAKINLTWDEFNKLCDLIDMDWKRWNKNNAKSIPMVADRAVEHLEWITNKRLKGLDPKDVTISYTIPGSGIDEYDTGTQNTQTIYELIEGMAWDNYNPYNESAFGKGKPTKSKDVTIRVHIEWGGGYELGDDEDVEQWLDDVDLPDVVYIKIPREFYDDNNVGLDLSSKLSETFDGYVEDYDYQEVDSKRIPIGARIFYWRPETDIMEEF